jgi:hypothetical protein
MSRYLEMSGARLGLAAGACLTMAGAASAQVGDPWWSVDAGGSTNASTAGALTIAGTFGQPDAGALSGGALVLSGGFWAVAIPEPCYANCDQSTSTPLLNVNDFVCFQSRFAAGDPYANCDGSTTAPTLTVNDFICFQALFAAGCP